MVGPHQVSKGNAGFTLIFLAEPGISSTLGYVSLLPLKASVRTQVSLAQVFSATGSLSLGMPQGDTNCISFSSQLAWKGRLLMKSAH